MFERQNESDTRVLVGWQQHSVNSINYSGE